MRAVTQRAAESAYALRNIDYEVIELGTCGDKHHPGTFAPTHHMAQVGDGKGHRFMRMVPKLNRRGVVPSHDNAAGTKSHGTSETCDTTCSQSGNMATVLTTLQVWTRQQLALPHSMAHA